MSLAIISPVESKAVLPLTDENLTILQATIQRLQGLDVALLLLICNAEHRFQAAEQLRQLGMEEASIFLEPVGRNTAPAIALAALQAVDSAE